MDNELFKLLLVDGRKSDFDHRAIADRFKKHAMQLMEYSPDEALPYRKAKKCEDRANTIVRRRLARNGMSHLKEETYREISELLDGVKKSIQVSEHQADELAAAIHEEFPWLAPATENAWHNMRLSASRGGAVILRPTLLAGPPGLGKTAWSHFVADLISSPIVDVDASNGAGQFALIGLERGWSNAEPGRVVRALIKERSASAVVFVDELDKTKDMLSKNGRTLSLSDALLPLLERQTAKRWMCPFYAVPFDMTQISWIFAANDASRIPAPLQSRIETVQLEAPSLELISWFLEREAGRAGLSDTATEAALAALEVSAQKLTRSLSLRDAKRIVRRAEALETRPAFH